MFENGASWVEGHVCITMVSKLTITHSRKPLYCKIFQLPRILKVFLLAQLAHLKTCREMNQESENVSDRELFSELFENPIHPLLINIVPPFVNENSPVFHFELNGEADWRWSRKFVGNPTKCLQLYNQVFCLSATD